MLNFFRQQGAGQAVVFTVVVGIIVVFALEFRAGSGGSSATLKTECAVSYRGNCVDAKDYFAAYGILAPRGLAPKDSRSLQLKKVVLDGLAERELLVAEAERLGFGVSDAMLDKELSQGRAQVSLPVEKLPLASMLGLCRSADGYRCTPGTPAGVRQLHVTRTAGEGFDYKLYEREIRLLANRGAREFRTAQERELLAEQLRELVRSRVRVPESEAYSLYERDRSRVVIRSVVMDREWFAKFGVDTSTAAVERWAATNAVQVEEAWKADKDKFAEGCPIVSEVRIALPPNALDAEKTPLKERAQALRERLVKGEAFAQVAREASTAPSAAFGGSVGCLNASFGLGSDVLLEAATKLAQGAVSDVIETPRAFHVLRRDGTLAKDAVEKEGKHQVARALYVRSAADEAMRAFANALIEKTRGGAKLEEAMRVQSDELARRGQSEKPVVKDATPPALLAADRPRFEVSAPFSASGNPLPDIDPNEPIAALAFALPAADAVHEKPIETSTGLLVMQLKEKMPASKDEFEKEKGPLLAMLEQAKGNEALVRYVADLRRAAGDKLKVDARFAEESKPDSNEE
ncbi:MAG TPA: peptidylprolyl isomerase [Polyangiaceae bacterium]